MKRLLAISAIIIVIVFSYLRQTYFSDVGVSSGGAEVTEDVLTLYPDAKALISLDVPGVYSVNGPGEVLRGYLIDSRTYSDHIKGWAGATPVLIAVSPENIITGIHLLPNSESGYVRPMIISSGLLRAWNGTSLEDSNLVEVDAVTAATITSRAIEKTIKHRLGEVSGKLPVVEDKGIFLTNSIPEILIVVFALIVCFYSGKRKSFLRIPLLVLMIIYLGFVRGYLLSMALFASWINSPGVILYSVPLLILAAPAILVPLFAGRSFYCGYVCPFGALQELLGKIPAPKKVKVPSQAKAVKYILLLASAIIVIGGFAFDLTNIEPFTVFLLGYAKIVPVVIAIVFLILSIFTPRPWCVYCCPTGCLLASLKKKRT